MSHSLGARDRELLSNHSLIVGIDEVGRGSLAGPVVVGAVGFSAIPEHPDIKDSKQLSPRQRERLSDWVREHAESWLAIEVWPELIDRLNILEATRLAMSTAGTELAKAGAVVVTDAVAVSIPGVACHSPRRADSSFFCVASASIVAKTYRDELMTALALRHDRWEWQNNKGYGTQKHRIALDRFGRSFLHRRSFAWSPVLP